MKKQTKQYRRRARKAAVQGACNACEKLDESRAQDWTKFLADEPTAITAEMLASRYQNIGNLQTKDLAQPIVNIQNAPAAPDPVGLQNVATLLGKGDLFKDAMGLAGTQNLAKDAMTGSQEMAKVGAEAQTDPGRRGRSCGAIKEFV